MKTRTLLRQTTLIGMVCLFIMGLCACGEKDKSLTEQQKALIEKSVFDRAHLTKDEGAEVQKLISENKNAEDYWSTKKHEFSMKDWTKPSTAKPSKDFP